MAKRALRNDQKFENSCSLEKTNSRTQSNKPTHRFVNDNYKMAMLRIVGKLNHNSVVYADTLVAQIPVVWARLSRPRTLFVMYRPCHSCSLELAFAQREKNAPKNKKSRIGCRRVLLTPFQLLKLPYFNFKCFVRMSGVRC